MYVVHWYPHRPVFAKLRDELLLKRGPNDRPSRCATMHHVAPAWSVLSFSWSIARRARPLTFTPQHTAEVASDLRAFVFIVATTSSRQLWSMISIHGCNCLWPSMHAGCSYLATSTMSPGTSVSRSLPYDMARFLWCDFLCISSAVQNVNLPLPALHWGSPVKSESMMTAALDHLHQAGLHIPYPCRAWRY